MTNTTYEEKPTMASHNEDPEVASSKEGAQSLGDYAGAHEKTDPLEIKLVRKLDMRIMPTLWAMVQIPSSGSKPTREANCFFLQYFMNYLDRNAIANARLNGLEKDLGLVKTQYVFQLSYGRSKLMLNQVQYLHINPLRWVCSLKLPQRLGSHRSPANTSIDTCSCRFHQTC